MNPSSLALVLLAATTAVHAAAPDAAEKRVPAHTRKVASEPPPRDAQVYRWLDVASFGEIALYKPQGPARGLALFASGDGGWNRGVTDMAHQAAAQGLWVAGFSTPRFLKALDAGSAPCSDADGALARLAADLARSVSLPPGQKPFIIGYSSGATVAYTTLAADAGERFAGGISLGFCPDLLIHKAFCPAKGGLTMHWQAKPATWVFDRRTTVEVPWIILQGEQDQVCDPKFAPEFADGQKAARAVMLPKVGHGFGAPRNWMPQYVDSLKALMDSAR